MEENLKIGQNSGISRTNFWVSAICEFRHLDGKTGYIHLHKVVDLCFNVLKKQTTHKTEFYSFSYTPNTKQWLESVILSYLKLVN
jgi:hypothetical protein